MFVESFMSSFSIQSLTTLQKAYLWALGANVFFAIAAQYYTNYSRKFSAKWTSALRIYLGFIFFTLVTLLIPGEWSQILKEIKTQQFLIPFLLAFTSGVLGLALGDMCFLQAFKIMGPSRSIMMFGFQPILMLIFSAVFFQQDINLEKVLAMFFCIFCVLILSMEQKKKLGYWEKGAMFILLLGMLLDTMGIFLSRYAFDLSPSISPWRLSFYRTFGASTYFLILSIKYPFFWKETFSVLTNRDKCSLFFGLSLGVLSLGMYLVAVKSAHLASLSSLALTGTLFSSTLEHIQERRWPSWYFLLAFISFAFGVHLLFRSSSI